MTHPTLSIIRNEHGTLSAMLRSITLLLAENRRRGVLPDFSVLRAMLFYVDEFAERRHHTKESQLLFPRIRARCTDIADVLDRLDADHGHSEHAIRDLEHELLGFEMMGDAPDGRRAARPSSRRCSATSTPTWFTSASRSRRSCPWPSACSTPTTGPSWMPRS